MSNTKHCPNCLGSGQLISSNPKVNGIICPTCGGIGRVKCSIFERFVTWGMP